MTVQIPTTPIEWAKKACDSLMDTYRAGELPPRIDGTIIRVYFCVAWSFCGMLIKKTVISTIFRNM